MERDRERVDAKFLYKTRPRRDCLIFLGARRDQDKTELEMLGETETRQRVSVSFFMRLRREPTFNEEID